MSDGPRSVAEVLQAGQRAATKARAFTAPPKPSWARSILDVLTGYPAENRDATALDVLMAAVPLAGAMKGAGKAIKAYHGSPHDFDKFSLDKIGTGEGAQAYGHGLYFAENEGTAQVYKQALGDDALKLPNGNVIKPTPGSVEDRALAYLATYSGGGHGIDNPHRFARQEVQKLIDRGTGSNRPGEMDKLAAIRDRLWEWEREGITAGSGGKMYEVNIKADPDQFLDWDAPMSQQPARVRDAIMADPVAQRRIDSASGEHTGRTLYGAVGGNSAGSQHLRQAGIPGIKYLDQGSRPTNIVNEQLQKLVEKHGGNVEAAVDTMGRGVYLPPKEKLAWRQSMIQGYKPPTRNYVVFDDSIVDILRKYGLLPAAVGTGVATQESE